MGKVVPEFSPEQMSLVRKMARDNRPIEEVVEALGLPLRADAIRHRAKKIGVTFYKPKAHAGTSKLSHPDPVVELRRSENANA